MLQIVFILVGIVAGFAIGYFLAKNQSSAEKENTIQTLQEKVTTAIIRLENEEKTHTQTKTEKDALLIEFKAEQDKHQLKKAAFAQLEAELNALDKLLTEAKEQKKDLETKFQSLTETNNTNNQTLASLKAQNDSLLEKLQTQKEEIALMSEKFNLEFTNIANKILDQKTEKFTNVNQENLDRILKPLGENIEAFKKQVSEVYNNEAKERFSLGEQVKHLADLNKQMSQETQNLTKALKGESKTQGRWGEMILESILEKSGLRKGEEYLMEHQLTDADGNALRSDSENKKMRPDAVIKYPDNREVIVDSKVSLTAFSRFIDAETDLDKAEALAEHISSIKNHIVGLHKRGYDDYNKSLDFVMMFMPSEAAYMAAIQADPELWNFAYEKRILLLNPSNLITSLKLVADLWKREQQNLNANEIAERGAKLYDKFVGFVDNLNKVGENIDKAQKSYTEAYKQLSSGNDNLVRQTEKLKTLGIKNKKELNQKLVENSRMSEGIE